MARIVKPTSNSKPKPSPAAKQQEGVFKKFIAQRDAGKKKGK